MPKPRPDLHLLLFSVGAALLAMACLGDPKVQVHEVPEPQAELGFLDHTESSGLSLNARTRAEATCDDSVPVSCVVQRELARRAGGIAVADLNGDGWFDLFVLRGSAGPAIFINAQDGSFEDRSRDFGVTADPLASGPVLADFDADGFPELLLGGVGRQPLAFWRNVDGEHFEEATRDSGLSATFPVLGAGAGDVNNDGSIDLLFARWGAEFDAEAAPNERVGLFWVNDGRGVFSDETDLLRYPAEPLSQGGLLERALAPNFADFDNDGDADVLLVQDSTLSAVFQNRGVDGSLEFADVTRRSALDTAEGLLDLGIVGTRGTAIGDYDNDGRLDWFISDAQGGRLLRNAGDRAFEDASAQAKLSGTGPAGASCFADFDNDGLLDLFIAGGTPMRETPSDAGTPRADAGLPSDNTGVPTAARLLLNQGEGRFIDVADDVGLTDTDPARAAVCFDYNHDGDVDILLLAPDGTLRFYANTLNPWGKQGADYLCVKPLRHYETQTETPAVGTRVRLSLGSARQIREVRLHNGYLSQDSPELHFGIGDAEIIDRVDITWPDGAQTRLNEVQPNQCIAAWR